MALLTECHSAWLVVDTQVKACSSETNSPSRASKTYGHNAFQIIHIHTTVINCGRTHTTHHRTHCGLWLRLQSWLMPQSPHRLRNDLKCVQWDVKPCSIQSKAYRLIALVACEITCYISRNKLYEWGDFSNFDSTLYVSLLFMCYAAVLTIQYSVLARDVSNTCENYCQYQ